MGFIFITITFPCLSHLPHSAINLALFFGLCVFQLLRWNNNRESPAYLLQITPLSVQDGMYSNQNTLPTAFIFSFSLPTLYCNVIYIKYKRYVFVVVVIFRCIL
jgi:hypothetical protein